MISLLRSLIQVDRVSVIVCNSPFELCGTSKEHYYEIERMRLELGLIASERTLLDSPMDCQS